MVILYSPYEVGRAAGTLIMGTANSYVSSFMMGYGLGSITYLSECTAAFASLLKCHLLALSSHTTLPVRDGLKPSRMSAVTCPDSPDGHMGWPLAGLSPSQRSCLC